MVMIPIEYAEMDQLYRQTVATGLGILAVAGVDHGQGTTSLVRALGERCAAGGQTTLIVDLNLAHPELHHHYDLEQWDWHPGLETELPVQQTRKPRLSVLCAPKQSANRWEFRDLASLLALLNQLRTRYEVILIDTSPLCRRNQGNIPPETVCSCADATLLSIMSALSSETRIRDGSDLLRSVNANVVGAVLNDRFAPSLVCELIRETYRFEKFLPKFMGVCRRLLRNSTLLNQDI